VTHELALPRFLKQLFCFTLLGSLMQSPEIHHQPKPPLHRQLLYGLVTFLLLIAAALLTTSSLLIAAPFVMHRVVQIAFARRKDLSIAVGGIIAVLITIAWWAFLAAAVWHLAIGLIV
jgi:hypothetical protein